MGDSNWIILLRAARCAGCGFPMCAGCNAVERDEFHFCSKACMDDSLDALLPAA